MNTPSGAYESTKTKKILINPIHCPNIDVTKNAKDYDFEIYFPHLINIFGEKL